jgi:hypothetical protein
MGLLNVLQREKIELGMVVGCSGGSMYAALMALGYDSKTIAEITLNLWTREVTSKRNRGDFLSILFQNRINSLMRFSFQTSSIMSNNLYKANFRVPQPSASQRNNPNCSKLYAKDRSVRYRQDSSHYRRRRARGRRAIAVHQKILGVARYGIIEEFAQLREPTPMGSLHRQYPFPVIPFGLACRMSHQS